MKSFISYLRQRMAQSTFISGTGFAMLLTVLNATAAHAGTPLRQVIDRPWDFFSAIYSVFASWQIGNALRGSGLNIWGAAYRVLQLCLWLNPVATAVFLVLASAGLAWLFHAYVWPRIVDALRARGFST